LPSFLKHDGTSYEMYIGLYFGAFFKKVNGMFEFEIKIMVVRVGTKPDFLQNSLCSIGFDLLLLLFLLIFEFGIIYHLTNGRISRWRNFDEIKIIFFSKLNGFLGRKYGIAPFYKIANYPYFSGSYLGVYFVWFFLSRFKRFSSSQNSMVV